MPKAISATTSTLRPGRQDALRSPSAVALAGGRPAAGRARRCHTSASEPPSRPKPAPKKAPAAGRAPRADATTSAAASRKPAAATPSGQRGTRAAAAVAPPASSARGLAWRSAAQGEPDARRSRGDGAHDAGPDRARRQREVERPQADRVDPDRAQPEEHQPGEDARRPRHPRSAPASASTSPSVISRRRTRAARPAERAQQADLARALLDAQPEEEPREQQRRHQQEHAEREEVLAEVARALRGRERLRAHGHDREAGLRRVEPRRAARARTRARASPRSAVRGRDADRGGGAQAMAPQRLRGGERQERLRRRPVLLPVASRPAGPTRERSTGNGGSQSARCAESVMPGYSGARSRSAAAPESGTIASTVMRRVARVEASLLLPDVVRQLHGVADARAPARAPPTRRGPGARGGASVPASARSASGASAADERVRHRAVADAQLVREVRQHRRRPEARRRGRRPPPRAPPRRETKPVALSSESASCAETGRTRSAQVLERQRRAHGGVRGAAPRGRAAPC